VGAGWGGSAFNGLALYDLRAIARRAGACRYNGTIVSNASSGEIRPICEHVYYHRCLRREGLRIAIDPSLVSISGSRSEQSCGRSVQDSDAPRAFNYSWLEDGTVRKLINRSALGIYRVRSDRSGRGTKKGRSLRRAVAGS